MDGWEFWAGKPLPGTTRSCKNGLKNNQSHCLFVKSVELWRHLGNNFIFGIMHDTYGLQSIQYSIRLIWYEMSKFWIFIKINYVFRSSTFQSTRGPQGKCTPRLTRCKLFMIDRQSPKYMISLSTKTTCILIKSDMCICSSSHWNVAALKFLLMHFSMTRTEKVSIFNFAKPRSLILHQIISNMFTVYQWHNFWWQYWNKKLLSCLF